MSNTIKKLKSELVSATMANLQNQDNQELLSKATSIEDTSVEDTVIYNNNDFKWENKEIEQRTARMQQVLKYVERGESSIWMVDEAFNITEGLGVQWEPDALKIFKPVIDKLEKQGKDTAIKIERIMNMRRLERPLKEKLTTVSSVDAWLNDLEKAEKYFEQNESLDDEIKHKLRQSKESLAWFRAKRNIKQAEVAIGGDNVKKAKKMYGEAQVMLTQDWAMIFPGETPPKIGIPNFS